MPMKRCFRQNLARHTKIEKLEARNKKEKDYFLDKDNLANFKAMRKQNGTDEKFCF